MSYNRKSSGTAQSPESLSMQLDSAKQLQDIDIENSIKAQESAGYAHWAKINNLKQAAKTVNFLTENNILQYADLSAKVILRIRRTSRWALTARTPL